MYKIGLKRMFGLFNIDLELFIPVFHEWIQKDTISNHIMVDVADYKHIPDGPGIMLIAHEGNFSIDLENGEVGLQYIRKQPLKNDLINNIHEIKSILNQACNLLTNNEMLREKISFNNQYRIIANDRYHFPNNKKSQEKFLQYSEKVFKNAELTVNEIYSGSRLNIKINDEV